MLEILHSRRRAYSDFGVYGEPDTGHVSTSPSVENNMDKKGVEGALSRGSSFISRTPSPSPSRPGSSKSRSRSRDRKGSSSKHATGHLAAHAFNLMVNVPQYITKDDPEDEGAMMGKLTPDLLGGHHYEADISDQSDTLLDLPPGPGIAKSAPSTPQTEQRIVPRPLPRHDTFVAPGIPPTALQTSPHFRPMKLKTTSFSKTNRHALKNLSRSTPAMSPSASPRHSDSEGPPRVSKGTKKFMRHFADAPPSERVLNYFACALVSDILLQGTLFITPNFFAFYSKIFGHVSRLLIPVTQVSSVQKERTAKIIPNAVGLQMLDGKNYVFGSLLSRDSTYKLMNHIWRKAQMIGDSDSEPPSAAQVAVLDDDADDSVSGSADSLMEEDQPDGYLPTRPLPTIGASPTTAPPPWGREGSTTTTNTNSSLNSNSIIASTNSTISTVPQFLQCNARVSQRQGTAVKPISLVDEPGGAGGGGEKRGEEGGLYGWITQGLVKTCFKVGAIPIKVVGKGVRELWALPRTSMLLLISTMLLALLFASAAFMLHRVDVLSQQLGLEKYDEYNGMYEEVLQMQQRLHAAASTEIEKTLSIQLKHIATVRQSLEALVVLFNKEPPMRAAQIPDNT